VGQFAVAALYERRNTMGIQGGRSHTADTRIKLARFRKSGDFLISHVAPGFSLARAAPKSGATVSVFQSRFSNFYFPVSIYQRCYRRNIISLKTL
jgi:hypothetical protein